MRILHVVHDFLPHHVAGVEVYTDQLTRRLAAEHTVGLLYTEARPESPNYALQRGRHGDLSTYEIVNNHTYPSFEETYRNAAVEARFVEVLDEFRPEVLHLQHLIHLSVGLVGEARRRGIPLLMTLHDHWLACARGGQRFHPRLGRCKRLQSRRCGDCTLSPEASTSGGVRRQLATLAQARKVRARWRSMRKLAQDVDLFVAPSAYLRDEFIDFGIPTEKVIFSDYGFETAGFAKRNDLPRVARRFGFLGSLMHHKGVHVLLEAFEALPADARLDVCGALHYDPDYTKALQGRVKHPGVRFVGSRPPEEVPRFLQEIDCLVVPSIWQENSPLTIHEAFLSGVPVVASRMGGHPGLLGEGGGLLYDADDVQELRSQLQWLYESPGALTGLAESAPPVKPMSDHVLELVELYEGLVERARSQA